MGVTSSPDCTSCTFFIFIQPVYYTNGASLSAGSFQTDFVTHEKQERIAGVTVDVYEASETNYSEDNRIVRLQSSKGA